MYGATPVTNLCLLGESYTARVRANRANDYNERHSVENNHSSCPDSELRV